MDGLTLEQVLRDSLASFEQTAQVMRETSAEAHDRGRLVTAAHTLGISEGLTIAATALRIVLEPTDLRVVH